MYLYVHINYMYVHVLVVEKSAVGSWFIDATSTGA